MNTAVAQNKNTKTLLILIAIIAGMIVLVALTPTLYRAFCEATGFDGTTQRADTKRTYVVRANGEVVAQSGGRWFGRDANAGMKPGDAIVVPLKLDQPLQRWSAITTIIYNMALAAAAVHSF